jgi:hypothetical protein
MGREREGESGRTFVGDESEDSFPLWFLLQTLLVHQHDIPKSILQYVVVRFPVDTSSVPS